MSENPRIAELRRRVESDPASIAFAQLAEEYRREGGYEQAVEVCRTGLAQYPSYLSARVTLGRALTELGRLEEARAEIARVLQVAPDNIAARRAMDDLAARLDHQTSPHDPAEAVAPERAAAEPPPPAPAAATAPAASPPDRGLAQLESWLEAILRDRAERAASHAPR